MPARLFHSLLPCSRVLVAAFIIPLSLCRTTFCANGSADSSIATTATAGPHLLVEERPGSGTVAVEVRVRGAGPVGETDATNGLSHFLEHMVFKGTPTRQPGEIDAAIERLGGDLTAYTARDWTRFSLSLPAPVWREGLTVLADMLLRPALRPADVAAEQTVILSEMETADSDTYRTGLAALCAAAFSSETPYRLPLMGTRENVRRFNVDSLKTFHTGVYRPERLTIAVVGDVTQEAARNAVAELFAPPITSPPATPAASPELSPSPPDRVVRTTVSTSRGTRNGPETVFLAFHAPPAISPDAAAAEVLASLLGRSSSGDNRLLRGILAQSLTVFSASAEYLPLRQAGLIVLSASGPAGTASRLETALLAEIESLTKDGISESDITGAQNAVIGQMLYDTETPEGAARRLADADALGLPPEQTASPSARVRAVTATDVLRVARLHLDAEHRVVTVVGQGRSAATTAENRQP